MAGGGGSIYPAIGRAGKARTGSRYAAALACALALLAIAPAPADARGIEIGFADSLFRSFDPRERAIAYEESLDAGAGYARLIVGWESIAPRKPLNASDPSDPAYRWGRLDSSLVDAAERGLEVLITIHAAPPWAERPKPGGSYPAPPGTDRPSAKRLAEFAYALARRYDGGYVPLDDAGDLADPGREPLPRVELFEAWNEPNLTGFLAPQNLNGRPHSPVLYRRLLNAVYRGVHAAQPGATVIAGATAPFGSAENEDRFVRPLEFMRRLLCLKGRNRLEARGRCKRARFDLLSHHPISPEWEPRQGAVHPDNVTIPEMGQLRRTLRAAERQGTVRPTGLRRELWATEFWWETSPPTDLYDAPSERRQARNIADGLRMLWQQRIPVGLLFQIRDDAEVTGPPRKGWGSGLVFADGSRKRSFRGTRFPLVADRVGRRAIAVWTRAPAPGTLELVARGRGRTRTFAREPVAAGEVFRGRFELRGRARVRARVDGERSLGWRVPGGRRTR